MFTSFYLVNYSIYLKEIKFTELSHFHKRPFAKSTFWHKAAQHGIKNVSPLLAGAKSVT